jgi:poly [ADP-ribose] polymerase
LICDADLLAKEVAAHHLDIKRMPLGKLSKAQLSQGYRLLDQLSITLKEMDELKQKTETKPQVKVEKSSTIKQATSLSQRRRSSRRLLQVEKEDHEYSTSKTSTSSTNVTVRCSTRTSRLKRCQKVLYKGKTCTLSNALASLKKQLHTLSSEFYTQIPHDFGMDLPPIIDDMAHIRMKMDLLHKNDINPLDQQYEALQVELVPLDPQKDEIYRIIEQYVETTHAPTHIQYKLHVNGILQISRPEEEQFTQVFESINNHKLLWHGSRLCNLIGILSKGLRIAPSEAPTNGYMFGKGVSKERSDSFTSF